MCDGDLSWSKAKTLSDQATNLTAEQCIIFQERVLDHSTGRTLGQFRDKIRREITRIDSDALHRRALKAVTERKAELTSKRDGMATLTMKLPGADAVAAYNWLDEIARANKAGGDAPGEMAGYGPIDADLARHWPPTAPGNASSPTPSPAQWRISTPHDIGRRQPFAVTWRSGKRRPIPLDHPHRKKLRRLSGTTAHTRTADDPATRNPGRRGTTVLTIRSVDQRAVSAALARDQAAHGRAYGPEPDASASCVPTSTIRTQSRRRNRR
jgi:hypothetical protein